MRLTLTTDTGVVIAIHELTAAESVALARSVDAFAEIAAPPATPDEKQAADNTAETVVGDIVAAVRQCHETR